MNTASRYAAVCIVPDSTELDQYGYLASDEDFEMLERVEDDIGSERIELVFIHASDARGRTAFASAYTLNGERIDDASAVFAASVSRVFGVQF